MGQWARGMGQGGFSRTSRKVRELKANPKVCVYYADHVNAKGYVSITGTAKGIDDKELLLKMKRDYWSGIPTGKISLC